MGNACDLIGVVSVSSNTRTTVPLAMASEGIVVDVGEV